MRVFVTGGTGLVGRRLCKRLRQRGDEVTVLSRRPEAWQILGDATVPIVQGDPTRPGLWQDDLAAADAAVHLAGENVAGRWNEAFKQRLRDSRVSSTTLVAETLAREPFRADGSPKVLVNASAIGYYGPHEDEELAEDSPPGSDFLSQLCVEWEAATKPAEAAGVRVARLRVGVVLDPEGGVLGQLLGPFKWFVGGRAGSGRQWVSWIHYDDLLGIILLALDDPAVRGPLNGTAPNPVTNREFSKTLGRVLRRPSVLPMPGFLLRLFFGEKANLALTGQRVLPKRVLGYGYPFRFPELEPALRDVLGR